jgi:hypothetical protein
MAILENQLETWSHPGAQEKSKNTYAAIKAVLEDTSTPYSIRSFDTFLQGSYGNSTNIRTDSDVDIVMRLDSINYNDISKLDEDDAARFEQNKGHTDYSHHLFKEEVLAWLKEKYGTGVKSGSKAIFIPGNNFRRDADVLVCTKHITYLSYPSSSGANFWEGVCFWNSDNNQIVNYPKQHLANCKSKNQNTSTRFKLNVRVFKNIRKAMVASGYLDDGVAPSYFIEGMLWNIPNENFASTFQQTFINCINWLGSCDPAQLSCANDYHYLIRDGAKVCWNLADYNKFRTAAVKYWNDS